MAKVKVTVKVVPVSGEPVIKEVDHEAGMTVAQALQAAGIDPSEKNITLQDVVAVDELNGHRLKPGAVVTVTQRPRGS